MKKAFRHIKASSSNLEQCNAFTAENLLLPISVGYGPRKVALKDNIATLDLKTTCASNFLRDYKSPFDATVAQEIQHGGRDGKAFIRGKTNMDEFGMGTHSVHTIFGPVRNKPPYSDLSAGGSSGGSAMAVAGGNVKIALGTDTGGSVRLPAAYTGTVGFKPSYGMISRWGVVPYANSLDTVGIFAKSCKGIIQVFNRLRRHDPRDPTSATDQFRERARAANHAYQKKIGKFGKDIWLKNLRIGVPIEYNIAELHDSVRHTWIEVLEKLRQNGHTIVPISLPTTKLALSSYYVIAPAEAASNLAKYDGVRYGTRGDNSDARGGVLYAETRGEGFGEEVKRRILLGSYTLSSEAIDNYFIKAQKVRRLVQRDFDRVFAMPNCLRDSEQFDLSDMDEEIELENKLGPAQVDIIICPTTPTLPPKVDDLKSQSPIEGYMNDVFTVPASLAGLPAISVPVEIQKDHQVDGNVPFVGIQVIGQYWNDFAVLNVGDMIHSNEVNLPNGDPVLLDGQPLMRHIISPDIAPVGANVNKKIRRVWNNVL